MTNIDVFKILSYGVIGLGFLLAFLSYRLLSKEQGKEAPRREMLRAINTYMAFSLILCVVGVIAQFVDRKIERTEEAGKNTNSTNQSTPQNTNVNKAPSPSYVKEEDKWIVVIQEDDTLEDAQAHLSEGHDAGYNNVITYKKDGKFRNVIVFDSQQAASGALSDIKARVNRTSFLTRLGTWCPKPQNQNGYVECAR